MAAPSTNPAAATKRPTLSAPAVSWAILAAISLRAAVIAWLAPPASWDGAIYARLAEGLARGEGFVHWGGNGRPTAFFPVGFPASIAAVMSVTGLGSTAAAWVVNVLSTVVTVLGAASIGRTIAGEIGARRAAWAFALYPAMLLWSAATMTETLQCAWITVAIALAVARPNDEHKRSGAQSVALRSCTVGLAAGLATLVRPQGILLAPVLGALSPRASLKHRALGATVALAAALAVCAPWTARNARALDGPALVSTNGGSNLLIGTLPEAHGGYRELTDRDPCAQVRGEVRRDRCMSRAAIERIRREPAQWIALGARKVARMIGFEWAPVSYARSTVPQRISQEIGLVLAALCTLCWWLAMALSARFVWRQRESEVARAVAATFITVVGVHAVFITDDRYHLVLVGALCAVAANAFSTANSEAESQSSAAFKVR